MEGSRAKAQLPLRVLVVDDEPIVLRFLARALRRVIRGVDTATDGQDALDRILAADELPDVVLSDLAMPRLNGIELARRLRQLDHAPPVVLMTAYDPPEVQQLLAEGVLADFLRKPTPVPRLVEVLERHAATSKSAS